MQIDLSHASCTEALIDMRYMTASVVSRLHAFVDPSPVQVGRSFPFRHPPLGEDERLRADGTSGVRCTAAGLPAHARERAREQKTAKGVSSLLGSFLPRLSPILLSLPANQSMRRKQAKQDKLRAANCARRHVQQRTSQFGHMLNLPPAASPCQLSTFLTSVP